MKYKKRKLAWQIKRKNIFSRRTDADELAKEEEEKNTYIRKPYAKAIDSDFHAISGILE